MHVANLFIGHDAVGCARLAGTRRTTRPMNEELHLRGEVVMNHILQQWNIDTSRRQVCDDEHAGPPLPKLIELVLSRALVHRTIDVVRFKATFLAELVQVFDVILGSAEDDRLLLFSDVLPENVEESRVLLPGPHDVEVKFKLVGEL